MAKLFIYLSSIISLIRDFLYKMVTIFRLDHMIGENQHFLVFTHVTFALATVAIRHVGSQTNSLNRESLNRFFALFCAVEVEVTEIN